MISSNDLQKCINLLGQISIGASYDVRQKAIEIGYILKKELDIVVAIEQSSSSEHPSNLDMKGLINDNIQLFHENNKLLKDNIELKNMLDSRVHSIAARLQNMCDEITTVNSTIASLI